MLRALIALLPLMAVASAAAQLIEVNGGDSSLYQAEGGGVTIQGRNYESGVSGGSVAGRFVVGAHATYRTPLTSYTLGIEDIRLNLPTDLFDLDHRILGVGFDLRTTRGGNKAEAFVGETSSRFDTPFFQGALLQQSAETFQMQYLISPTLALTMQATRLDTFSILDGLEWKPRPGLRLAASGGFVAGTFYGAASVDEKTPRVDLKAAYIRSDSKVERPGSATDLAPEPVRENFQITVRPSAESHFSFTAARQNALVPEGETASGIGTSGGAAGLVEAPTPQLMSTVDQGSVSAQLGQVNLSATGLHSSFGAQSDIGYTISASTSLGRRLHVQNSYYWSQMRDASGTYPAIGSFVTTVQETVNRRLTVSETVDRSDGQTSVSFGGSLLSNFATITADYETYYVPTRPTDPFQRTLMLDVQMHLLGRLILHGGTYVSPQGKMLYTAEARGVGSLGAGGGFGPTTVDRANFGKSILSGRVVDTSGEPIPGAMLEVAGNIVLTDIDGRFFFREQRSKRHPYKILFEQFLDGHSYRIVSKPEELVSVKGGGEPTVIVLARQTESAGAAVGSAAGSGGVIQ